MFKNYLVSFVFGLFRRFDENLGVPVITCDESVIIPDIVTF